MFKTMRNNKGEAYVGEAVKIVVAIVLGAALLAGLVLIANKVILPKTQGWIEKMFDSTDKYSGSITDGVLGYELTGDIKERMVVMFKETNSFYAKHKDDAVNGGEICEIYTTLLYGGEYYGVTREKQKEALEKDIAEHPEDWDAEELEYYQDWCNAFAEADSQMNDPNLNAFANEAVHYMAEIETGETTEEEAKDKVVASAERHGYNGEAVRTAFFG